MDLIRRPSASSFAIGQKWQAGRKWLSQTGSYTEVPYGKLSDYLANASSTGVNRIEITGPIPAADVKGMYSNPGALGSKIKIGPKKVALKLPNSISGLTDMSFCFSKCTNLVSSFRCYEYGRLF